MEGIILFLFIALAASALTAIGCWRKITHNQSPTIRQAVLAALIASLLPVIFICLSGGPQIFTISYWMGDLKPGVLDILLPMMAIWMIVGLLPSSVVVFFFQRKMSDR